MGYWNGEKKFTKKGDVVQESKEKVEDVLKYPFVDATDRGIRKETCEKLGIRAGLSQIDGKTVEAYYFPSYNQKGKVVGFMKQDITLNKEEKGHWKAIGSVNIGNKLFGQDVAEANNRKRNNIVITEGQWDTASAYQALIDSVKGTKYEGLEPFVVSIPLGTANAVEAVLHNKDFIKSFDGATFFFDDDYCTPAEKQKGIIKGHEARELVAAALLDERLPLFNISPDYGLKDASDYMQQGKSSELAKLIQFGKRPFSLEKIIRADQITLEELLTPQPQGVVVDCFPLLMKKMNGFRMKELTMLLAPSNVGKCHGKGQEVLMYDMSLKKVEDVQKGDKLFGPDGTARTVLETHSGFGTIYKVTPNKGKPYTVNSEHLLALKSNADAPIRGLKKNGDVFISAKEFVDLPKHYREHVLSGYYANPTQYGTGTTDHAYMLGLWLAEGSVKDGRITLAKKDKPLHEFVKQYAEKYGMCLVVSPSNDRTGSTTYALSGGEYTFRQILKDFGVFDEKSVPVTILKMDYSTRMEVLAGFVDGDGYKTNNCYEFQLKNNKLVDGIVLLARSVGIRVTEVDKFNKCQNFEGEVYRRLYFFGNTQNIPCRLERKKVTKQNIRDTMRTGLTVEPIGEGEYFGFEVDGDNLYCLPDFQVTHNSTVCSILAHKFIEAGYKLGMIFLEEGNKETFQRLIAADLKVNYLKFKRNPLGVATAEQIEASRNKIVNNNLLVLLDHFGSLPITDLMSKIKHMVLVEGCRYILLDHISAVISGLDDDNERKTLDVVMTNLASFCAAHEVHIIVVSHINRQDSHQFLPPKGKEGEPFWVNVRKESARGSAALEQFSWNILSLEPEILPDFSRGRVRLKVLKTRFGDSLGVADVFTLNPDTWEVVLDNGGDF